MRRAVTPPGLLRPSPPPKGPGGSFGGGRGIRTPGALRLNGFQVLWSSCCPVSSWCCLVLSCTGLRVRPVSSSIVLYHPVWFASRLQTQHAARLRFQSCQRFLGAVKPVAHAHLLAHLLRYLQVLDGLFPAAGDLEDLSQEEVAWQTNGLIFISSSIEIPCRICSSATSICDGSASPSILPSSINSYLPRVLCLNS